MPIIKRATHKIQTNPKYKCLDEGSEDEGINKSMNEDIQQQSSKELHFRENFLKFESKL